MHVLTTARARLSPQVRKGSLEALGRVHPTRLLAFAPAIALRLRDPILSVRLGAVGALVHACAHHGACLSPQVRLSAVGALAHLAKPPDGDSTLL